MKTSLSTINPFINQSAFLRQQQASCESCYKQASSLSKSAMSFTTKEGDIISINQNSQASAGSLFSGIEAARIEELQITHTSEFSIGIQGHLNDQELADLARLLEDLSGIAKSFFNGNLSEAVTGALNIGDMGSIAELDASFSQTSIFRQFMSGSHPVPPLENTLAAFDKNKFEPDHQPPQPTISPWQQLLEFLYENDPFINNDNKDDKSNNDPQATAQSMFAKTKETLTDNPRLSPLIPTLSELATLHALNSFPKTSQAEELQRQVNSHFAQEMRDWLI